MECLYIATKFNNEARARLVIRWAELEEKERQNTLRVPAPKVFNQVKCIHYTGWLLQNGYSIMSGQVRARIKKYPEQFRKTDKGWYMSEAIAERPQKCGRFLFIWKNKADLLFLLYE